jgi:hypothetical protein
MAIGMLGSAISTTSQVAAADAHMKAATAEATSIQQATTYDVTQQQRQNRLLQGTANAQTAASGVALTSGTPLFQELDRAKQSEIQALNIQRTGQVAIMGKQYEARMARRQIPGIIAGGVGQGASVLTSFLGRPGASGGGGGGFGTANSTASSSSNNWYGGGGFGAATS